MWPHARMPACTDSQTPANTPVYWPPTGPPAGHPPAGTPAGNPPPHLPASNRLACRPPTRRCAFQPPTGHPPAGAPASTPAGHPPALCWPPAGAPAGGHPPACLPASSHAALADAHACSCWLEACDYNNLRQSEYSSRLIARMLLCPRAWVHMCACGYLFANVVV